MQHFGVFAFRSFASAALLAAGFLTTGELMAARAASATSREVTLSFDSVAPMQPENRVSGRVTLWVSVSAAIEDDVREIEMRLDGAMVCEQKFSAPLGSRQGKATINCPIDTTDRAPRGARFPNGKHVLSVAALNGAGAEVAVAAYPEIVIDNRD